MEEMARWPLNILSNTFEFFKFFAVNKRLVTDMVSSKKCKVKHRPWGSAIPEFSFCIACCQMHSHTTGQWRSLSNQELHTTELQSSYL